MGEKQNKEKKPDVKFYIGILLLIGGVICLILRSEWNELVNDAIRGNQNAITIRSTMLWGGVIGLGLGFFTTAISFKNK